jgi:hypothetical protein
MPLSWNEIRDRSLSFSREWATECSEDAEAKSFWDGFFNVFGNIAGYQTRSFGQQDPVNVQAAEKLGKLHDLLKSSGYDGHPLEVLIMPGCVLSAGVSKSDYRYSAGIVYNNFPWPEPTDKQQTAIEAAAQRVPDARTKFPTSTLADLYDPLTMPPELVKAHQVLDRAVDAAYGKTAFKTEAERVAFLFERYQVLVAPLVVGKKNRKTRQKKSGNNAFDRQSV